jgi:plasmid stabilization system protein ParE
LNTRLTRAAEADVLHAASWYEAQRDGLGAEFVERVQAPIEKISANPMGYAKVINEVRRCGIQKFPYALWFRVEDDAIVIACLHGSRDLRLVNERAAGIVHLPKPGLN